MAPPITAMTPLRDGQAFSVGLFELRELEAVQVDGAGDYPDWVVRASWELVGDIEGTLTVDGVAMTMDGQGYLLRVAPTEVRQGEVFRTRGPRVGWRPRIVP